MIYYNIILDLKNDMLKAIEFKNIENARNLKIYVKELDVTELDMQGVFKQGDNVYVENGVLEDSVFMLALPNLEIGEVEAELIFTKNSKVVASKTFKYTITDSLSQEFISEIEDKDTLLDKILKTENAETARQEAELDRTIKEDNRVIAENARNDNEESRVVAETSRVEAETSRVEAENIRIANETDRKSAEELRTLEENKRADSELDRETKETLRQEAELDRIANNDVIKTWVADPATLIDVNKETGFLRINSVDTDIQITNIVTLTLDNYIDLLNSNTVKEYTYYQVLGVQNEQY